MSNFMYKKLQGHKGRDEKLKQVSDSTVCSKQDDICTFRYEAFTLNAVSLFWPNICVS